MMATQLLIYDGDCAYCRGFVQLVRLLDRKRQISVLGFDAPEAQALLRAQFGEHFGFTMYLFEVEEVSWSREAARRIIESLSLPRWMAKLAFRIYPSLVHLVSKLTQRTRLVCGPKCVMTIIGIQPKEFIEIHKRTLQELQRVLSTRRSAEP